MGTSRSNEFIIGEKNGNFIVVTAELLMNEDVYLYYDNTRESGITYHYNDTIVSEYEYKTIADKYLKNNNGVLSYIPDRIIPEQHNGSLIIDEKIGLSIKEFDKEEFYFDSYYDVLTHCSDGTPCIGAYVGFDE